MSTPHVIISMCGKRFKTKGELEKTTSEMKKCCENLSDARTHGRNAPQKSTVISAIYSLFVFINDI